MATSPEHLRDRAKQFAVRIVRLFKCLPKTDEARIMGKQVLRADTSVAANYHAVSRARSRAEFISKMGVVVEEIDETAFRLELLVDTNTITEARLQNLLVEANKLLAILAAAHWTEGESTPVQLDGEMTR